MRRNDRRGLRAVRGTKVPQERFEVDLPDPPARLDDRAAQYWCAAGEQMIRDGLFALTDGLALASWCAAQSRIDELTETIAADGLTVESPRSGVKRHPSTLMLRESEDLALRLAKELGLTPVARLRLQPDGPPKPAGPNPWDDVG